MENLIGKEHLLAFEQKFDELFLGNRDATQLALDMLYVVHVWDDLIDKDPTTDKYINTAFRKLIYDIPCNPVMTQGLSLLWLNCYHQWLAANEFEDKATDDKLNKAYMLRASIYQLFNHIAMIVGGIDYAATISSDVYDLYGETLDNFIEEVRNA